MNHHLPRLPALFLFLAGAFPARAQTITIPQPGNGLEGFELTENGLYSWRGGFPGGGGELGGAPSHGMVHLMAQRPNRPAGPGTEPITLGQGTDVAPRNGQTLLLGNYWFYYRWVGGSRRLYRHPMVNLFQPGANIDFGGQAYSAVGPVTGWNSNVVWAAAVGGVPKLFVKGTGSAALQESNLPAGTNLQGAWTDTSLPAKMAVIKVTNNSGSSFTWRLVLMTNSGQIHTGNPAFGALGLTLLATNCTDFAWRNEEWQTGNTAEGPVYERRTRLYVTTGLPLSGLPGHVTRFDLTNGDTSTSESVTAPGQQLTSISVDSESIFVTRTAIHPGGGIIPPTYQYPNSAILRKTEPAVPNGNFSGYGTLVVQEEGKNLRSDGSHIYWLSGGSLRRLESGAPLVSLDYGIIGSEVTQAVQTLNNDVPLVAGRQTLLRLYARELSNTTGKGPFRVSAMLEGTLDGVSLGNPLAAANSLLLSAEGNFAQLRPDLNNSFNFYLPAAWTAGAGRLRLTATINPFGSVPESNPDPANNRSAIPTTLHPQRHPCLVFKQVNGLVPAYDPFVRSSNGSTTLGFNSILARARSLMPVSDFHVRFSPGALSRTEWTDRGPVQRAYIFSERATSGSVLDALESTGRDSGDPLPDSHWVGMLHNAEFWPFFDREGKIVPELGGTGGIAPRPGNSLIVKMRETPSFSFQPGFDNVKGGAILAHELAHNYGRKHIRAGGSEKGGATEEVPFDPETLGLATLTNFSAPVGFDFLTPGHADGRAPVVGPTEAADMMSYKSPEWISPHSWQGLFDAIPASAAAAGAVAARVPRGGGAGHAAILRCSGSVSDDGARVRGFRVRALPANSMEGAKVAESLAVSAALGAGAPLTLQLWGGTPPALLATHGVPEPEINDGGGSALISQDVPWTPGTAIVRLVHQGTLLTESRASTHPPVLTAGLPGVDEDAGLLSLAWAAADADGDPLLFTVQFCQGSGASWQTLSEARPEPAFTVGTRLLAGGPASRLRVLATDGFHTTLTETADFTLPEHAPSLAIEGVLPGQVFPFGGNLVLGATAYDAEDGSLDATLTTWTLTGAASRTAVGRDVVLSHLPPGDYSLTAEMRDSDDQLATQNLLFTVRPPEIVTAAEPPVLDGYCADAAYAAAPEIRIFPDLADPSARLVHVGTSLHVAVSGIRYPAAGVRSTVRLYLNPDTAPTSAPDGDDLRISVDQFGLITLARGTGSAWQAGPESETTQIHAAVSRPNATTWNAEFTLPDDLLGGWNRDLRFALALETLDESIPFQSPVVTPWPAGINPDQPGSYPIQPLGPLPPVPNRAPLARAELPEFIPAGTPLVLLDGSGSTDPDGDALQYTWTQTGGPAVALVNPLGATATFSPPSTGTPAALHFRLVVGDGTLSAPPVEVSTLLLPALPEQVIPPVDTAVVQPEDGAVRLVLFWPGENGDEVIVQSSADPVQWEDLETVFVSETRRVPVTWHPGTGETRRFFRLKLRPVPARGAALPRALRLLPRQQHPQGCACGAMH